MIAFFMPQYSGLGPRGHPATGANLKPSSVGVANGHLQVISEHMKLLFVLSAKPFLSALMLFAGASVAVADSAFEAEVRPLLSTYCVDCHGGKRVKGKVDFTTIKSDADVRKAFELWESVAEVVASHDMPPDDEALLPTDEERAIIADWYGGFVESIEARAGVFRPRRLSAKEFENTLESLMGFALAINVAAAQETVTEESLVEKLFPPDPPGDSGFKNDTANTVLSPVLFDQYAAAIEAALGELFTPKRRPQLEVYTGPIKGALTAKHAERALRAFLPRAHRRPVNPSDLAVVIKNVQVADELETALRFEMKAAMLSSRFLYRGLLMPRDKPGQFRVDSQELAERLSYFIWGDMPDAALHLAAADGTLATAEGIDASVTRMLQSPKARALAEIFAMEWLGLDEIKRVGGQNPVFKRGIEEQPIAFANYLFVENRPLIELLESQTTFASAGMAGYYDAKDRGKLPKKKSRKGVERVDSELGQITLTASPYRGGLLTMPGVLMMNRGPVNRGTWILERILGDHLPDPPADVGQVPKNARGQNLTFRQRFEAHRANKTCALCHDRIDPLGFALDGYDNNGRPIKSKKPIDTSGRLPSGEAFADFQGLKTILTTSRRQSVIRNIVERTLSYGLARSLTIYDRPTVDRISRELDESNGGYGDLVRLIARSLPFTHAIVEEI
jgi:hypothetical protein